MAEANSASAGRLIGHSLGGAAALAAAGRLPEVRGVATIAAPAGPAHVVRLFQPVVPEIETRGEAEVLLAGRPFRIRKKFLDDIDGWELAMTVGMYDRKGIPLEQVSCPQTRSTPRIAPTVRPGL